MRQIICLICAALGCASARAGEEQDRFEEESLTRCARHKAERVVQVERWERAATIRDLQAAYPGKLANSEPGKKEDEGEDWFALVAGKRDEWRKTDAVAAGLGPMYERWATRLELGPVPSIKHDEFIKFSKLIIHNAAAALGQGGGDNGINDEADKVFRVLDREGDGELTGKALTTGLREDKAVGGRVSKEEYREYFRRRVEKKTEELKTAIRASDPNLRKLNPEGGGKRAGLPEWFNRLDPDNMGQVSLFEWRKAGRDTAQFQEMDLNGDGLLTPDEYLRWAKKKQNDMAQKKREAENP